MITQSVKESLWFTVIFISSCTEEINFNYKKNQNVTLDYTDSYYNGFEIPGNGKFFEISFNSKGLKGKLYKIYYQNESYKFEDNLPLASENFYGSWENTDIEFKKIISDTTNIKFRILGNPRNEERYFTDNRISTALPSEINSVKQRIINDKEWNKESDSYFDSYRTFVHRGSCFSYGDIWRLIKWD